MLRRRPGLFLLKTKGHFQSRGRSVCSFKVRRLCRHHLQVSGFFRPAVRISDDTGEPTSILYNHILTKFLRIFVSLRCFIKCKYCILLSCRVVQFTNVVVFRNQSLAYINIFGHDLGERIIVPFPRRFVVGKI